MEFRKSNQEKFLFYISMYKYFDFLKNLTKQTNQFLVYKQKLLDSFAHRDFFYMVNENKIVVETRRWGFNTAWK